MNDLPKYLVIFVVVCCAAAASAEAQGSKGIWELEVIITIANAASGERTICVLPDGGGPPLTDARTTGGEISDASITIRILDASGVPVAYYPREDIWLDSPGSSLKLCPGGTIADQDTDVNGETYWLRPFRAGGWNQDGVLVLVNGDAFGAPLNLNSNSPDLDGDLQVNLSDLALFSLDYFGGYQFRSDLCRDGSLDLLDVATMASGWGVNCP